MGDVSLIAVAGDDDDRHPACFRFTAEERAQFVAVEAGKSCFGHDEIGRPRDRSGERIASVSRLMNADGCRGEILRVHLPRVVVAIDQKDEPRA